MYNTITIQSAFKKPAISMYLKKGMTNLGKLPFQIQIIFLSIYFHRPLDNFQKALDAPRQLHEDWCAPRQLQLEWCALR